MLRDFFKKNLRPKVSADTQLYLITGLGNPGAKYADTWHNCGFMVLDILSQRHQLPIRRMRFKSLIGQGKIAGEKCVLQQPDTFMNRSGEALQDIMSFYKMDLQRCMIIYDDIDLPVGTIRIRPSGGPGTHNGMRSITSHLGSNFPRLRIGIGPKPPYIDMADYVLSSIPAAQKDLFWKTLNQAADAVETWIEQGLEKAMADFNRK